MTTEIHAFNALDHVGVDQNIHVVEIDEKPWFVVRGIVRVLGSDKANNFTRRLNASEKGTSKIRTLGGTQSVTIVSESGFYKLTMRAHRSNTRARAFQDWVTKVVLPTIHPQGRCLRDGRREGHHFGGSAIPDPGI